MVRLCSRRKDERSWEPASSSHPSTRAAERVSPQREGALDVGLRTCALGTEMFSPPVEVTVKHFGPPSHIPKEALGLLGRLGNAGLGVHSEVAIGQGHNLER